MPTVIVSYKGRCGKIPHTSIDDINALRTRTIGFITIVFERIQDDGVPKEEWVLVNAKEMEVLSVVTETGNV